MFFLLFSPQLNHENVPVKSNRGDRDWKIITFSFKCGFACFERQGFYALIITLSGMVVHFAGWNRYFEVFRSHARVVVQTPLLPFFFSFYFLNALQSDNNNNTVHVLEHKYVLAFLVVILTLLRRLGLKLLSRPQNIFIPAKLKFYNWLAAHNLSLVLDTVMTFFLGINRVRKMDNIPWNFKSWLNNEDQTSVSLGQISRLHILLRLQLTRYINRENR